MVHPTEPWCTKIDVIATLLSTVEDVELFGSVDIIDAVNMISIIKLVKTT